MRKSQARRKIGNKSKFVVLLISLFVLSALPRAFGICQESGAGCLIVRWTPLRYLFIYAAMIYNLYQDMFVTRMSKYEYYLFGRSICFVAFDTNFLVRYIQKRYLLLKSMICKNFLFAIALHGNFPPNKAGSFSYRIAGTTAIKIIFAVPTLESPS